MSNVPDKFYQVCRLCLAVACDSDIPELSMYDISKRRSVTQQQQHINNTVIISNAQKAANDKNVLNHKKDSLHQSSADKDAIDCNASGLHNNDGNGDGADGDDDDDESRIELHERIYTFLSITVSQTSVLFFQ